MYKAYRLADSNIRKEAFENVIDLCFNFADHFTLSDAYYGSGYMSIHELTPYLEPFVVHSFRTAHAFLNPTYKIDEDEKLVPAANTSITVYKADRRAKQIILDVSDNIYLETEEFDWFNPELNKVVKRTTFHGEDLCFFAGDNLLLGTLSHEYECILYPFSTDILAQFQKYATWVEDESYLMHFVRLSDYPLAANSTIGK